MNAWEESVLHSHARSSAGVSRAASTKTYEEASRRRAAEPSEDAKAYTSRRHCTRRMLPSSM